jgi:hypothetical protein
MNVRKDDLAVIVKGANAGKLVNVVNYLGVAPVFWGGYVWDKSNAGSPMWLVESSGSPMVTASGKVFFNGPMPDSWLRPIRGDVVPEEVEHEIEVG